MGVSQERISRAYQCHSWAKILSVVEACSYEHLYFSFDDKILISRKVDVSNRGEVGVM